MRFLVRVARERAHWRRKFLRTFLARYSQARTICGWLKNESIAKALFQKKLQAAVTGEHVLYVITEREHLLLLPEGALRILVTADLEVIKERFAQRMRGQLPAPVAMMLEKKHGCFDAESHDIHVVSGETDTEIVCKQILDMINKEQL